MISLLHTSKTSPVHRGSLSPLGTRMQLKCISIVFRRIYNADTAKCQCGWLHGVRRVPAIVCRAENHQLSAKDLVSILAKASNAWDKYDTDRNGTLSLKECESIFNSTELSEAFESLTNIPHCNYNSEDLASYFKRADKDASGALSRTEFLALYLAVIGDRIKRNPLLLAQTLLGFLDQDKNGVLEGRELKQLLLILGFAPALLLPIPGFVKVNYRAILGGLGSLLEGGKIWKAGKAK